MSKGINKVELSGTVKTDIRKLGGGDKKVALSFQLNVDPGTFNVKVWEPKAAISKGDRIQITEGRLSNRSYERERDGVTETVWVTEVVTDGLHVMPLPEENDDLSFS